MKRILPVIVVSQFCCTSLWFAGNAVMKDLVADTHLGAQSLALVTSSVQLGFIVGTLCYSFLLLADRFRPAQVFFTSAVLGAAANAALIFFYNDAGIVMMWRILTGFFLAGIYPVGMKIAADHYAGGLGKALGFLVGALVLGTAFPHLLKSMPRELPWKLVLAATSALCLAGGTLLLLAVPDGPYRRTGQRPEWKAFFKVFHRPDFRAASFGYFGHMWELYSFWAFVPVFLSGWMVAHAQARPGISASSFAVIAAGAPACILGGYLSRRYGAKKPATIFLLLSGTCCVLSPLLFFIPSPGWLLVALLFWGMVVIADSPLFSTLVADNAVPATKGTALTFVTCIGFSITIISIQLTQWLAHYIDIRYLFVPLALGPLLGLLALRRKR